jgi:hypothetical protein
VVLVASAVTHLQQPIVVGTGRERGSMPDVTVMTGGGSPTSYFLDHDFDLIGLTDIPHEGPYGSFEEAEAAGRRLLEAITGADD